MMRQIRLHQHVPHPHFSRNANKVHSTEQKRAGVNAKIAVAITKGFGSMTALYILIAWMLVWMVLASLGFWLFAKDPYPFQFLLFCSNLVQLWALPAIMVGQNVLNRKQEIQAEESFNTTMNTYHDTEQIVKHLDAQDQTILEIVRKLEEMMRNGSVKP